MLADLRRQHQGTKEQLRRFTVQQWRLEHQLEEVKASGLRAEGALAVLELLIGRAQEAEKQEGAE